MYLFYFYLFLANYTCLLLAPPEKYHFIPISTQYFQLIIISTWSYCKQDESKEQVQLTSNYTNKCITII